MCAPPGGQCMCKDGQTSMHCHTTSDKTRSKMFHARLEVLSPLVPQELIKAHLKLIGASGELLLGVEGYKHEKLTEASQPSTALDAFLRKGVHRLELWLTNVVGLASSRSIASLNPHELPPLDVAMMLHAYYLSPHRFFEDGIARLPQLSAIGVFPMQELAQLVDAKTFKYHATQEQIAHWEQTVKAPFDPFDYQDRVKNASINCPQCYKNLDVPWENDGSGYAEANFRTQCPHCQFNVTYDSLCVAKLLRDLQAAKTSGAMLAGSMLNARGDVISARARLIADEVIKILQKDDGSLPAVSEVTLSSIAQALKDCKETNLRQDGINTLLRPYSQPYPFSQDLVRSVYFQRPFNMDLREIGWCNQDYLSGDCQKLQEAYERYVKFLELIMFPEGRVAPSHDVDLVWHTHQLGGARYRETITALTDLFIDHISFEEDKAAYDTARGSTVLRWKDQFENEHAFLQPTAEGLVSKPCQCSELIASKAKKRDSKDTKPGGETEECKPDDAESDEECAPKPCRCCGPGSMTQDFNEDVLVARV